MPSPLPAGVTSAVVRLTVDTITEGQHCQTTHDYLASAAGTPALSDLDDFLTRWNADYKNLYLACLSPLSSLFSQTVAEIHYGTTPTFVYLPASGAFPGTQGATNLPLEVAATCNRIGSIKGKHGRGRFSMPAVPDTFVTPATAGSKLNSLGVNSYNALAAGLTLTVIATSFDWYPIISVRPAAPNTTVQFATRVTAGRVNPILGTQRRRKLGRGI